ncbi:hypothetical protein C8J57DRAFT_1231245 [Mycena rebaudengoi]|nr:hypothetical protein C8J57DRAFT_1231245 [Mycena rebaudengoi]
MRDQLSCMPVIDLILNARNYNSSREDASERAQATAPGPKQIWVALITAACHVTFQSLTLLSPRYSLRRLCGYRMEKRAGSSVSVKKRGLPGPSGASGGHQPLDIQCWYLMG